jgi:hypothetical protein
LKKSHSASCAFGSDSVRSSTPRRSHLRGPINGSGRPRGRSCVTLLPVIGLLAWGLWNEGLVVLTDTAFRLALAGAALVSLLYYPASLATVAVWEHALPALNPAHVVRVIRIMRSDYAIAVLLGAAGVCAGKALVWLASPVLDAIPFVGSAAAFFIATWAAFWAAHLLGWAVHRHVNELGWN